MDVGCENEEGVKGGKGFMCGEVGNRRMERGEEALEERLRDEQAEVRFVLVNPGEVRRAVEEGWESEMDQMRKLVEGMCASA